MSDFDALREKVEQTAGRLTAAQTDRQRRTEDLLAMLGELEEKFNVQKDKLDHYRDRVEPLEQSNRELTGLMHSLLNIIDSDLVSGQDDPLHRATDMASRILAEEMIPAVAPESGDGAAPEPEVTFEDVPAEMLAEEAAVESAAARVELSAIESDAEAEALAMTIGAPGAEEATDANIEDGEPVAAIAVESEPPAQDTPDAETLIAEEIAAADLPEELAEPAAAEAAIEEPPAAEAAEIDIADAVVESEPLTAELDIPEPDAGAVLENEAESAVAEALEEALDTLSEAEAAAEGGKAKDKPDIRALLKRVEEAALRAQALTDSHAEHGAQEISEDAGPAADEAAEQAQTEGDTQAA